MYIDLSYTRKIHVNTRNTRKNTYKIHVIHVKYT